MSAGSSNSELMVNRDLDLLAPAFAKAVRAAIDECNAEGNNLNAMVYEAYRSQALQALYYQRGRTVIPPSHTVTNAPTNLHSWHGYGLAVDVVHRDKYWKPPGGEVWFRRVAAIFKKHGCSWGGDWKSADLPHFQWGPCPPGPSDLARELIKTQGMAAIWNHFGAIDNNPTPATIPSPHLAPAPGMQEAKTTQLGSINGEGNLCVIYEDSDGRVHFTADADIDADGANGQSGGPPAYLANDHGSEMLENGGMGIKDCKVICAEKWARDIVILGPDNEPKIFPGGVIASMTWYRHLDKAMDDPSAYVDSETVPYVVVPQMVVQRTAGIVRGCKARITWRGRSVDCVVADRGPANKIGEISIAAARAIGLNSSPRNGGTDEAEVLYELWPGIPAPGFTLQKA